MRIFTIIAAVSLIAAVACGYDEEQKAVKDAYLGVVDALESGDYASTYDRFSSNTRTLLDDLAVALEYYGMPMGADGRELLSTMLAGVDMSDLSRQINSITVTGSTAVVVTATEEGDETLDFVLENGSWYLDFEDLIRDALDEGMAGSGMTVDDLLGYTLDLGDIEATGGGDITSGTGSAPVAITNGLGSWDVYFAYVSPSSSSDWGEDRLGETGILSPGYTLTVWVDPGTYDLMVEDEDGDTYSLYGVDVGPSGYDWEVTLADLDVE